MENSIIRTIRLDPTEDTNNLNLLLEKEVKTVPAGYEVTQTQLVNMTGGPGSGLLMFITFNRVHSESVNGLPNSNKNTNTFSQTLPSNKQLKYLTYLVDSLQPEDFPGIDEITTSKLAGQWIKKLKSMQKGE